MLPSRTLATALARATLLATALLACSLAPAASAVAAEPATVSVRVEGLNHTLLPATLLTTTTTPVVKDGNAKDSCAGTSAAGALELATGGSWSGTWYEGLGYSVETIEGESYPFTGSYFWDFWLNNKAQEEGICEIGLQPGDRVLLFPCFYEAGKECPTPLGIEAPASAAAGEAVSVTVKQYNAKGEATPAVGATVAGGGENASTDNQGHATLRFSGEQTVTLFVSGASEGPPAVRDEASICVHEGNDGSCGTTAPASASPLGSVGSTGGAGQSYSGPYAVVAAASGLSEGQVYAPGHAPRVLAGKVLAHVNVASVSIELRRSYRGRCYAYNGTRDRFERARCGQGSFFKVASGPSFSYLLPHALAPGRYVYDLQATDSAGHSTTLARGTSRIVFYVR